MFCENCGANMPDGTKYCGNCGAIMETTHSRYEPVQKSQPRPMSAESTYLSSPYNAPSNAEPLRVGQYIGIYLLMIIPFVNIIFLFIWSFGSSVNLNKKNFARASLIMSAVGLVILFLSGAFIKGMLNELSKIRYE